LFQEAGAAALLLKGDPLESLLREIEAAIARRSSPPGPALAHGAGAQRLS
jgi:hypothetical protein